MIPAKSNSFTSRFPLLLQEMLPRSTFLNTNWSRLLACSFEFWFFSRGRCFARLPYSSGFPRTQEPPARPFFTIFFSQSLCLSSFWAWVPPQGVSAVTWPSSSGLPLPEPKAPPPPPPKPEPEKLEPQMPPPRLLSTLSGRCRKSYARFKHTMPRQFLKYFLFFYFIFLFLLFLIS